MTSENTLTLSRDFIVNAVAEKLVQFSYVKEADDITNIQFGDLFGASSKELVPVKIFLKTTEGGSKESNG